jgi:hypothetical protein
MCPDLDMIFEKIEGNLDLNAMFAIKRKRFDKRTSSAVWDAAPGTHMHKRR